MKDEGLKKSIAAAGSQENLAQPLGTTQATVSRWKRVPAEHVLLIEKLFGLPRWEIRPDLYPPQEFNKQACS